MWIAKHMVQASSMGGGGGDGCSGTMGDGGKAGGDGGGVRHSSSFAMNPNAGSVQQSPTLAEHAPELASGH